MIFQKVLIMQNEATGPTLIKKSGINDILQPYHKIVIGCPLGFVHFLNTFFFIVLWSNTNALYSRRTSFSCVARLIGSVWGWGGVG